MSINGDLIRGWRIARFDEFLKRVERKIILDDSESYRCVGVRWYGIGAFVRESLLGMNIGRKQQWIIKEGDIVYNKLFAWKGSFAIANNSVDDCIVSDKFPTYQADLSMIDIRFLQYYFRMPKLAQQAEALSKGAAAISKLTLNPPQFWDLTIPLPPLEEQQRIVVRIEELATRIEEARGLRREAVEEAKVLPHIYARKLFSEVNVQLSEQKADQLTRFTIKEGDILFARMGTVGRCCVVAPEAEGWLFNYHIIRVALDKSKVDSRYIHWSIQASPDIEDYLEENIRGATRQGVNSTIVSSLPVRIPPLSEQRRIVAYLDDLQAKIDALKHLQAETQAELDALLPSILDKAFKGELV
jgi:type I restriction enzyme S subunit